MAAVNSSQAFEPFSECRTQALIRLRLVGEYGVAACIGYIESVQECRSRRLVLIRHIAVPGDTVRSVVEEGLEALILCTSMDQVNFGVAFWRT